MEKCVVRYSLVFNGLLALLGAVPSVLFGVISASSSNQLGWKHWSSLALFASIAILFGIRALDRTPRLVVDEEGITDGRGGVGFVPWDDVQKVAIKYMGRVDAIWIYPRNPETWWPRLSRVSRLQWRMFPKWRVISINLQNMDASMADIVAVLKNLAAQGKVELADA
jgi:hypothetical protein